MLDASSRISNLNSITYHELVFEHDIEAGNQVAYKILRAETQRDAGKSRHRQGRRDADMKLCQRRQQRHEPNNLASGAIKHARERTGLLFADLRRAALGSSRLDDQLCDNPEKAIKQQCNKEDGYEG